MEYELAIPAIKFTVETKCAVAPVNPTDLVRLTDIPGGAIISEDMVTAWYDLAAGGPPFPPLVLTTIHLSKRGDIVTMACDATAASIETSAASSVKLVNPADSLVMPIPAAYRPADAAGIFRFVMAMDMGTGFYHTLAINVAQNGQVLLAEKDMTTLNSVTYSLYPFCLSWMV